jgi:hypothetical protein
MAASPQSALGPRRPVINRSCLAEDACLLLGELGVGQDTLRVQLAELLQAVEP